MICSNCGCENEDGSRFCEKCGTSLPVAVQEQNAPHQRGYILCPNCGFENESGSRFCKQCGTWQIEAAKEPYAPPQPAYNPSPSAYTQSAYAPPPYTVPGVPVQQTKKKSKAGLIIGICAGVLFVASVVVICFLLGLFLPAGPSAEGYWVNEDEGVVLSLEKDGALTLYSLAGAAKSDYDFDSKTGEGGFEAGNNKYEFTADEDQLNLTNTETDDTLNFNRVKEEPEIDSIVTARLIGLWTNEQLGEVLEFTKNGMVGSFSPEGQLYGEFGYDTDKGEGFIKLDNVEYAFTSDSELMTINNSSVFEKAPDNLDIEAFVSEHSNKLLGIWYDTEGKVGTLNFLSDGIVIMENNDISLTGSYEYHKNLNLATRQYEYYGSMLFVSGGSTLNYYLYLYSDELNVVDNNYEPYTNYTQDNVNQN